jgi:hypothetical protein
MDSEAKFSYYKQCQLTETAKRSVAFFLLRVPGKSRCCLLPCLWLYRVPALGITLTRHMILPYPYASLFRVSLHGCSLRESTWDSCHDDPVLP